MTLHLSSLVRFFCVVTMLAIWLSGVQNGLAGSWSAIGFLGVVFLFTSRRETRRQPLTLLLSLALLFYFGLRLWDLYVIDLNAIGSFFPVGRAVQEGVGGRAMPFAMISCFLMYSGLALAGRPNAGPGKPPYADFEPFHLDVDKSLLFRILLAYIILEGVLNFGYVFTRGAGFVAKLLAVVASHEGLIPIAAMAFVGTGKSGLRRLYVLFAGIMVSGVLAGWRSAPVDIAEIMLAWAVIPGNWNGTLRVSFKTFLLAIGLIVMSGVMFVVATTLRQNALNLSSGPDPLSLLGSWDNIQNLLVLSYQQIAYRVGTNMDALLYVFSSSYDRVYADAHVNLTTVLQTTLRTVFFIPVPNGVAFDEYAFAALLGNRGSYVNGAFIPTGYSWGIFGYFYQICGYWAWPVLFALFLTIGKAFQRLARAKASLVRDIGMYCIAHAMELLVPMFGIANMFGRYRGLAVTFLAIAVLMPVLRRRRKAQPGSVAGEGPAQAGSG